MNKLLVSIMILSLVEATAAGTEAGIAWHGLPAREDTAPCQRHTGAGRMAVPLLRNAACDNVLLTASAVTVFEIQDNAGPTYIVCLESAAQPTDKPSAPGETSPFGGAERVSYTSINSLLPEPTTIVVLGLAGLLFHRPRIVRSVA